MDEADRAALLAERERTACVETARVRGEPEAPLVVGAMRLCRECGARIPPARLEAEPAAVRCTRCQEWLEKNNRGHRL